jgi:hypothetical protein
MSGLVINGTEYQVPGLTIENFRDNAKLTLRVGNAGGQNDGRRRSVKDISKIILHTTKGIPGGKDKRKQDIRSGLGDGGRQGEHVAGFWSRDPRPSGAHLVVDFAGKVFCLADLQAVAAYHAGDSSLNETSIGIEIYQGNDAELYLGQLEAVCLLVDCLTAHFRIQRQIPRSYIGPIPRLERGGWDCYGVFGHRDCTDRRGAGDPGDAIMHLLATRGYEQFDFVAGEDLDAWRQRQKALNPTGQTYLKVDGMPGQQTAEELERRGYQHGLWVLQSATNGEGIIHAHLEQAYSAWAKQFGGETALKYVASWARRRGGV